MERLTPTVLDDYALVRCRGRGAPLVKAVVWSLRTFGAYLALRGLVGRNPAAVDSQSCHRCPMCGIGTLRLLARLPPRRSPP